MPQVIRPAAGEGQVPSPEHTSVLRNPRGYQTSSLFFQSFLKISKTEKIFSNLLIAPAERLKISL